jgi:hypothetical protein
VLGFEKDWLDGKISGLALSSPTMPQLILGQFHSLALVDLAARSRSRAHLVTLVTRNQPTGSSITMTSVYRNHRQQ